jgi:hypothetical protein
VTAWPTAGRPHRSREQAEGGPTCGAGRSATSTHPNPPLGRPAGELSARGGRNDPSTGLYRRDSLSRIYSFHSPTSRTAPTIHTADPGGIERGRRVDDARTRKHHSERRERGAQPGSHESSQRRRLNCPRLIVRRHPGLTTLSVNWTEISRFGGRPWGRYAGRSGLHSGCLGRTRSSEAISQVNSPSPCRFQPWFRVVHRHDIRRSGHMRMCTADVRNGARMN